MAETRKFTSWYMGESGKGRTDEAHDVFQEGLALFSAELSQDPEKMQWIVDSKHGSLESVLESVLQAQHTYKSRKGDSKMRKALVGLSEKIHHYSGVLEVFVSHHPQYVALVYGAIKVLFVGVHNHQNLLAQLCAGLSDIASILPRTGLILQLYPTKQIKQVVIAMYANILKFLMRALRWYQESKLKHMLHSITRPTELRYNDLLATISSLSRSVTEIAWASSHAEQRDMHTAIIQQTNEQKRTQLILEDLITKFSHLEASVADQALNATAMIDLRQQVSEVQLAQLITHIAVVALPDPIKAFQASFFLAKRQIKFSDGPQFWLDPKVQRWNQRDESSLIVINGTRKVRHHLQYFCAKSISLLLETDIPVIWGLRTLVGTTDTTNEVSTIDLIKYLISQAIRANKNIHSDAALAPRISAYIGAKTEAEWIAILLSVLQGIPLLYIILDMEVLSRSLQGPRQDFWPGAFLGLFSELSRRSTGTILRVALVSYGSLMLQRSLDRKCEDFVVNVGNKYQARSPVVERNTHQKSCLRTGDTQSFDLKAMSGNQGRFKRSARRRRHH